MLARDSELTQDSEMLPAFVQADFLFLPLAPAPDLPAPAPNFLLLPPAPAPY